MYHEPAEMIHEGTVMYQECGEMIHDAGNAREGGRMGRRDEGREGGWLYVLALALLGMLLLSTQGCDPCARLSRRCPPSASVRDSIYVHDSIHVYRWTVDTLVRVLLERETVKEAVGIADTARAETSYAEAVSYADGTRLVLRMWNKDSAELLTRQVRMLEERLREAYSQRSETKVVTVFKCRKIVQAGAWTGLVAVIALIVYIALKMKKMFTG